MVKGEGHGVAADWWALGVLLYEMLVGESPFKGKGEMDMYMNITGHRFKAELRGASELGRHTLALIDELLHPNPNRRMGAKRTRTRARARRSRARPRAPRRAGP